MRTYLIIFIMLLFSYTATYSVPQITLNDYNMYLKHQGMNGSITNFISGGVHYFNFFIQPGGMGPGCLTLYPGIIPNDEIVYNGSVLMGGVWVPTYILYDNESDGTIEFNIEFAVLPQYEVPGACIVFKARVTQCGSTSYHEDVGTFYWKSAVKEFYNFSNTNTLYQEGFFENGEFYASDYIIAGNNVDILSGTSVYFEAGNYVKLNTGFHAQNNSSFTAIRNPALQETKSFDFTSSLDNVNSAGAKFLIYPNPCTDRINIKLPDSDPAKLTMYNILGEVIIEKNIDSRDFYQFDVESLLAGTYILKVYQGNKEYCKKILKK